MMPFRSSLPLVLSRSIAGLIASLAILPAAKAQTTFTWTNANGGSWATGTNWAGGVVADGANNLADFSTVDITAARTINLDGARTIGGLKFGDSNNNQDWTLATGTAGTLTLDPTDGTLASIEVINRTTIISAVLAGTEGLRKEGVGSLRLTGANTITGDLVVNNGTLQLGLASAITGFNPTIMVNSNAGVAAGNGTTLLIFDNTTIGAGKTAVLNTGNANNRATLMGQTNGVWQGDVLIQGNSPAAINSNTGTFTISGNITGTAQVLFARGGGTGIINGNINIGSQFVKTDGGTWIINTTGHTWTTSTQIADGQLQLGITNALPTTLPIVIGQASATNGRFELNGFNQTATGLRTDSASTGITHIIRNSSITSASNLTVDISGTDTLKNTHFHNTGALTLTKIGAGRLELQDGRYDNSNIALNDGTLAFTGSGNVTVRSTITGGATTFVEKSGIGTTTFLGSYNHAGTTTISDGRAIFGPGNTGAITVNDNAALGAGAGGGTLTTSSLTFGAFGSSTFTPVLGAPGAAPLLNATSLTLSGTGTSVVFEGANITPGIYPLVSYGGGAIGGNGFGGLSLGALGSLPHVTASLVNNTAANRVDLNVTGVDSLIWTGANGNVWDPNVTQNFKLASNNTPATFFPSDRVLFDDTGLNRAISVSGGVRIGNLTFNHSAGTDYTVMGALTGPGGITKSGTGTTGLSATAVSSISGNGTVVTVTTPQEHGYASGQQVTIVNSSVGAFNGTFTVTVVDPFNFTFANATTTANTSTSVTTSLANTNHSFSGSINVSDGLLILGGSNSGHGPVNITGGTLRLANANAISGGGPVTISNGGTLDVNGLAPNARIPSIHVSGAGVGGNGAIVNNGPGITNLNHALSITLDGDTTWGGTGRYDVNPTTVFNGGNFNLTKVGTNEMWYTPAAGSTLGNVTVNSGTFGVQSTNPLATTSTVTVNSGAFHTIFSSVNLQHQVVLNSGTLRSNNGTPVVNGTVTLNGPGTTNTIAATGTNTLAVAGPITGPGGFTKNDTGTVQLRNPANNYAGDTVVTAGTLNFSVNGVLPLTTNLIVNGGTFDPSNLTHVVNSIAGTGGVIGQGTALAGIIVTNQSTNTSFDGAVNRALIRMNGTGTLSLGGTVDNSTGTAEVNSGTLVLAKTGTLDVHGVGAAGVGLTINTGATVRLGGPQVGGGTGSNVPPTGAPANYVDQIFNFTDVVMAPGSVFDLGGFSEAIDGLTGAGTIRTSATGTANSRLYVGYNGLQGQFAGVIENGAGVVEFEKLGIATFVLSGANAYTGSTTVTGGALANIGGLATSALSAQNGTAVFSPAPVAGSVTLNGNAMYVGAPTGAIGGAVTLNGTSTFAGASAIGGNLTVNNTAVFNGTGAIGGNLIINGVYNGSGNITGSITSNTGSTISIGGPAVATVSAGSLIFPAAATRTLNIGLSGAAADRINTTTANGLTLDGTTNIIVQPGAGGWVTGNYPIFGYNGAVQGVGVSSLQIQGPAGHSTVSVTDNGTGTISLQVNGVAVKWVGGSGNNWDTNATSNWSSPDQRFLSGDGVRLDDTAASFTPVINTNVLPASVTFDTATNNYVLSGNAGIASGSLWKIGTGTATIKNSNTYTGPTGVQAGTLSAVYNTGIVPIPAASVIDISAGATFNANSPNVDFTFANRVTGTGTLVIDPNNGGTGGDRQVTLTGNLSGFAGTVKLSPTLGSGTFRAQVDSGLDMGVTSAIQVDEGGQIFFNTSGVAMANNITIAGSGYNETDGNLGALRGTNTTFTGNITVANAAKVGALGSTVTFTNALSGGELTFGGSNANSAETMILTGNAGGLAALRVNDGFATANAQTIVVSVGDGGTSGTLGATPVILVGDGFKTGAIRFDRSDGYMLGGPISVQGTTTRTDVQIDTLGTGFNSNGQTIDLFTGGGTFRVGVNRQNAVATINSILNAGTITVGALNASRSTSKATLNLVSDAVVRTSNLLVASGAGNPTLGNTTGATLNISGTASLTITGNLLVGEQNTSNGFVNQTGGDVSVGTQFRLGHYPNNTSVYNMSGGTFAMTGTPTQFPYATGIAVPETNGGMYLGIDGTGVFNQSGGTVRTNFVVLDNRGNTGPGTNAPTGVDTYTLTGGELRMTNSYGIISRNPTAAFNFNGGTIVAETDFNFDTNKLSVNALTGLETGGFVVTNLGRFGGNGTIALTGTGTLTNLDSASIEAGTNIPFQGGSLGGVGVAITSTATLESDRSTDDTWSGILTGSGKLRKLNTGTLRLTGNSGATFTGATTVNGGQLLVNGSLAGSTIGVNAGATLGGTGTVGPVNVVGGAVAPGDGAGTLITGPLALDSATALKFELALAGAIGGVNDLLSVNGNLTLDGTLQVTPLGGFSDGTYRLVNYTGTLTNNGLTLDSAFLALFPGSSISVATAGQVNLVVVPEPTALTGLFGGFAVLAGLRRFRRRNA